MLSTNPQRLRHRLTAIADDDAGFTLVEAVVSFILFAVVATASITAIVTATSSSNSSHNRVTAANLAQQDLQQVRAVADRTTLKASATHAIGANGKTYTGQGTKFLLTRVVPKCAAVGDGSSVQVTTTVTWPGAGGRLVMATELAC